MPGVGHTDRQIGRQASDRQASRQAGRQTDRQTDRQAGRQADRQAGRQIDRQTDRQAGRHAGRQPNKQTDRFSRVPTLLACTSCSDRASAMAPLEACNSDNTTTVMRPHVTRTPPENTPVQSVSSRCCLCARKSFQARVRY